jgi:hypothetical protein
LVNSPLKYVVAVLQKTIKVKVYVTMTSTLPSKPEKPVANKR